jgi:hypothetical protein
MVTVVHAAMEILRTVKPRAGADEHAASEPLWTIISGGSASIGNGIIITIGTARLHTDADAYLRRRPGSGYRKAESGNYHEYR